MVSAAVSMSYAVIAERKITIFVHFNLLHVNVAIINRKRFMFFLDGMYVLYIWSPNSTFKMHLYLLLF